MSRGGQAPQVLRRSETRTEAEHRQDQGGNTPGPIPDKVSPDGGPELPTPKNPFIPGPLISKPDEVIKVAVPLPPKADQ
jgi:hypothetical protein